MVNPYLNLATGVLLFGSYYIREPILPYPHFKILQSNVILYLLLKKVIFYCNFVTCNSLLPNTASSEMQHGTKNTSHRTFGRWLKWVIFTCQSILQKHVSVMQTGTDVGQSVRINIGGLVLAVAPMSV